MPEVRTASFAEVEQLLQWAKAEGWNPGLGDADAFYEVDTGGFFVAIHNHHPVAGISVVRHNDEHAFLGLYLCLPEFRGQGLGMAVWKHGIAYAGERTIGLDGVVEQQANYRLSGFEYQHRTCRYAGSLEAFADTTSDPVRRYERHHLKDVIALDEAIGGIRRERFYTSWTSEASERHSFVVGTEGALTGFMTIRRCADGYKVGPLLADSSHTASSLLGTACSISGGDTVFIDVPETSDDANKLIRQADFEPVFETARMYRGTPPDTRPSSLYGVATLELG